MNQHNKLDVDLNMAVLTAVSNIYISLHLIDLKKSYFYEIKSADHIRAIVGDSGSVGDNFSRIMTAMSEPEYIEGVLEFTNTRDLNERLSGKSMICHEFVGIFSGWCRLSFIPVCYDDEGVLEKVVFAVQEIDEEKRREIEYSKALEAAEKAASNANRAKSDFISNMSHEIRTPINAVLGMTEMIIRESDDKTVLGYAEDIRTAGNTLLSLVNDILDFSKIESGKMELDCAEYDLYSLIHDSVSMVADRAYKKGLEVNVHTNPDMPSAFFGDERRIRQIIVNLLTNAVKYTDKGKVTFSVHSELIDNRSTLCFSIKDTGIGISEENLSELFESFRRVDMKHNKNIEGTGLGLAITKQLVTLMDGIITVSSVYGEGSEFVVKLPQKVVDYSPVGIYDDMHRRMYVQSTNFHQRFTAPDARVLFVDDIAMNLKVVTAFLKSSKMKVDTANSGARCLEMVRAQHYDIIFMDHMMPVMDGIETLECMKRSGLFKDGKPPVIMLTANAVNGASETYKRCGFTDYLTKPIDNQQLDDMIVKYLPKEMVNLYDSDGNLVEEEPSGADKLAASVRGIDTAAGMMYCCESIDFYNEMLKDYSTGDRIISMNTLYKKKDWENYRIQAHSLKSTSLTVGLTELSEKAKGLEHAAAGGDIGYIDANHEAVMKLYGDVLDDIRLYIKSL